MTSIIQVWSYQTKVNLASSTGILGQQKLQQVWVHFSPITKSRVGGIVGDGWVAPRSGRDPRCVALRLSWLPLRSVRRLQHRHTPTQGRGRLGISLHPFLLSGRRNLFWRPHRLPLTFHCPELSYIFHLWVSSWVHLPRDGRISSTHLNKIGVFLGGKTEDRLCYQRLPWPHQRPWRCLHSNRVLWLQFTCRYIKPRRTVALCQHWDTRMKTHVLWEDKKQL